MNALKKWFKNISLSQIIDFILTNTALFLIIFAWTKFIFKTNTLIVTFITFTWILGWNIVYFTLKRIKKPPKFSNEDVEKWAQFVLSQNEEDNLKFLLNLFKDGEIEAFNTSSPKRNSDLENSASYESLNNEQKFNNDFTSNQQPIYSKIIQVGNNNNTTILSHNLFKLSPHNAIGFDYFESDLSLVRALKIVRLAIDNKINEVAIFCVNVDNKTKLFLENLKDIEVSICDKKCLALKTKKAGLTPPNMFEEKSHTKLKWKEIVSMSLTREKAKKYFFSGVLIFFCSLIVRQNIYYVLMSSFLFLLAILSLKRKPQPAKSHFWE